MAAQWGGDVTIEDFLCPDAWHASRRERNSMSIKEGLAIWAAGE
jgi:hypothetical protein